jgi:hypothetical protein
MIKLYFQMLDYLITLALYKIYMFLVNNLDTIVATIIVLIIYAIIKG